MSRVVNRKVNEMYQLRPEGCTSCVSYTDTIIFPERTAKRTCSAAWDTTHARAHTHTHKHRETTQRLRFRRIQRTNILEMRDISKICFLFLVVTLVCKLNSCSNHSAFFDKKKYCWFLLASNRIFKNPL